MKVDIILPVYKPNRWVFEAIGSVQAQTYSNWNLFIIDDHSPKPGEVLMKLREEAVKSEKIKFIRLERNIKPAGARNRGAAKGDGDALAFIDQDDRWHPKKLESSVAYLKSHPEIHLVHSDIEAINESGEVISGRYKRENQIRAGIPYAELSPGELVKELAVLYSLRLGTVVVRRGAFESVGGFDADEPIFGGEDILFAVRFAAEHKISHLPENLTFRRLHSDNLSKNRERIMGKMMAYKRIRERFPVTKSSIHKQYTRTLRKAALFKVENGDQKQAMRLSRELVCASPLSAKAYCFYLISVLCFNPKMIHFIKSVKKRIDV